MTPRESFNNLSAFQKLLSTTGVAGAALLIILWKWDPGHAAVNLAPLEAKLEAQAAIHSELRDKADRQTEVLKEMLKTNQDLLKTNQSAVAVLRLLCVDQVDDKLRRLCEIR